MSKINNAGHKPAFPTTGPFEPNLKNSSFAYPGITIRDWFAGQALAGIIKAEEAVDVDSIKERARIRQRNHRAKFRDAKRAYAVADAMLAARSEPGQ